MGAILSIKDPYQDDHPCLPQANYPPAIPWKCTDPSRKTTFLMERAFCASMLVGGRVVGLIGQRPKAHAASAAATSPISAAWASAASVRPRPAQVLRRLLLAIPPPVGGGGWGGGGSEFDLPSLPHKREHRTTNGQFQGPPPPRLPSFRGGEIARITSHTHTRAHTHARMGTSLPNERLGPKKNPGCQSTYPWGK